MATDRKALTGLFAVATVALLVATAPVLAQGDQNKEQANPEQKEGQASPPGPPPGPPPALVQVDVVRKEKVQELWQVIGRLVEVRRALVAAEQSGKVAEVSAEEGDPVKGKTTILARIEDVWAQLSIRAADAELNQRKARVDEETARFEQAKDDLKSVEELFRSESAKMKELRDAKTLLQERKATLAVADAELVAAHVQVARAQEDLARLAVTAPFDGRVVRKLTEVGQWVTAGSTVAEIISVGQIDAVIDVPERYVNKLSPGLDVEVQIESLAVTIAGKVVSITPMGSTAARTFPVKIRLDDRGGKLMPGMSVVAHVPTGEMRERLTVPRDAVKRTANGTVVWANLQGKAMPINVKVLFGAKDRFVVVPVGGGPPLMPGAQVVTEGAERLFPTQPLIPTNPQPSAADSPAGKPAANKPEH